MSRNRDNVPKIESNFKIIIILNTNNDMTFPSFQEEHQTNRRLSKLGSAIASGAATNQAKIPFDQALYIMSYGQLGKVGYTTLRLSLQPYGVVFPTYDEVSHFKYQNIIPAQTVSELSTL